MRCHEIESRLGLYVDGELSASDQAVANAHLAACGACAELVRHERGFRRLLRRQPGEPAPDVLRTRLASRARRHGWRRAVLPWIAGSAVAIAALVVALLMTRQPNPLLAALVDTHIAFVQVARPAEIASQDPARLATWFFERSGLRVDVADFSSAGIELIGGRLIDTRQRRAAYVLYGKGHTLLSVFVVPLATEEFRAGRMVRYRGADYSMEERKGYRTVTWVEDGSVFSVVSGVDYEALLECADRLRRERERRLTLRA